MLSAILYRKNLIFAEVMFANLQEIVKFAKFIALEKKAPYGISGQESIIDSCFDIHVHCTCTCNILWRAN